MGCLLALFGNKSWVVCASMWVVICLYVCLAMVAGLYPTLVYSQLGPVPVTDDGWMNRWNLVHHQTSDSLAHSIAAKSVFIFRVWNLFRPQQSWLRKSNVLSLQSVFIILCSACLQLHHFSVIMQSKAWNIFSQLLCSCCTVKNNDV